MLTAVTKPTNVECSLKPPTQLGDSVNPKYAYSKVFGRSPFTGTNTKFPRKEDKQGTAEITTKKKIM